jgi:methylmalonyl-CoA/ethylmalonyl-CoA epimerase
MDLSLHHVGLLVKEMPEAASLYLRLGYRQETEVIHDPTQTAHVQFFRLPGDKTYLELVTPDGDESKLANALRKGGGINHVCYATGALDATIEELRETGFFLISEAAPGVAFKGRRIAWMRGPDRSLVELAERGTEGELEFR